MAMTMAGLKAKIILEMNAKMGAPDDAAILDKVAEALAKAIVEYIQASAQVTVPTTPATVGVQ